MTKVFIYVIYILDKVRKKVRNWNNLWLYTLYGLSYACVCEYISLWYGTQKISISLSVSLWINIEFIILLITQLSLCDGFIVII